jgi:cyclopropane fatty-acyl-phospholipid synthase-like methyltransferase
MDGAGSVKARHWDEVYRSSDFTGTSWFEAEPELSLELIGLLGVETTVPVIDIGGGGSPLVDRLVGAGFCDVTVLDISDAALRHAQQRLGAVPAVTWLHEDLLEWRPSRRYGLWHDRALFHFLTEAVERDRYLEALTEGMAPGGAMIVATFAEDGPEYCSGLPVARYSARELTDVLGDYLKVVEVRRELHTTPGGVVQPFTWVAATAEWSASPGTDRAPR